VAANLDAQAARTGPGNRVSRFLQRMAARFMAKSKLTARGKAKTKPRTPAAKLCATLASDSGRRKQVKRSPSRPQEETSEPPDFEFISKSRQRQKQLRLAEAMREEGLDEPALAKATLKLLEKLLRGKKLNGSEKLLLDLLKEISRTLEPQGSTGVGSGSSATDAPMIVQLVHDVPRPSRTRGGEAEGPDGIETQEAR
jgi:hypothetical protein